MILGIDEVGRGPWAGPLVVGAVVLGDASIAGLADSKKLSSARRRKLSDEIRDKAAGIGLGWVHADELDTIGLSAALKLATRRAVEQITAPYHEIIIDGTINFLAGTSKEAYVSVLPKADALIESVSAASIVAKVARDSWMAEQDKLYPGYGFSSHVGYGTAKHRQALEQYGVTPLHRTSFTPIAQLLGKDVSNISIKNMAKNTSHTGSEYEDAVAAYLQRLTHTVVERNWRTKWCEIDIISRHDTTLYFTEVRYRSSAIQGGGIASITPKKLTQMRFAAEAYLASHPSEETICLQVASIDAQHGVRILEVE